MKKKAGLLLLVVLVLMAITASVSAQVPPRCVGADGAPIPCTPTPEPGTSGGGATADDPDGDGIVNTFDACPNEGGPSNNSGCPMGPDADGDGTSDDRDVCPTEGGPASNNGCPETTTTGGSETAVPPTGPGEFAALPALPEDTDCWVGTATTQGVNVRYEPSIDAEILAVLDPQQSYQVFQGVVSEGQLWYNVELGGGWNGWSAASALRNNGSCEYIPIFTLTPLSGNAALHVKLPPPQSAPEGYLVITLEDLIISSATGSERPEFDGPEDLHVCLFNVDFGAVTCDEDDGPYNPPGSPDGQTAGSAQFVCSYHKGLDEFICLDDFTAAPSEDPTAGESTRNPHMLGPENIGMCLYHPDYGTVICDPTPDGTYDPAAGATGEEQGGCVLSPDQRHIVCNQSVQDGAGRVGQLGMICDVAQNLCAAKVLTVPEEGGNCPETTALLLPAINVAREAGRRVQTATNGNLQIVDLTSFAATIPNADPCGINTYQFTQSLDETFEGLSGLGIEPAFQTREHILLARQVRVPA